MLPARVLGQVGAQTPQELPLHLLLLLLLRSSTPPGGGGEEGGWPRRRLDAEAGYLVGEEVQPLQDAGGAAGARPPSGGGWEV